MKIKLDCPHGQYDDDMLIRCGLDGDGCAFQRYKPCKGWSVNTEGAATCIKRRGADTNGTAGQGNPD